MWVNWSLPGIRSNSFQMEHLHPPQTLAVLGGRLPLKMPTLGNRCWVSVEAWSGPWGADLLPQEVALARQWAALIPPPGALLAGGAAALAAVAFSHERGS